MVGSGGTMMRPNIDARIGLIIVSVPFFQRIYVTISVQPALGTIVSNL